ncbi:MAG: hypothetical protein AMXMBFR56_04980 [Polyangiaceae bacterium]
MAHSEIPPPGADDPPEEKEHERRRLERLLPEIIKRIVEAGYEKITEGPENVREFVREMKLPKEVLALLLAQIDETKNGLYRVVAKEIRDFLEHTNFSEEMAKVLTMLSFEIKTEVRFIPNDERLGAPPKPEVRSKVRVKRDGRTEPPPRETTAGGDQEDSE